MKHHVVEPAAKSAAGDSLRPQHPEKLKDLVEDPAPEPRDMAGEQAAAFIAPGKEEPRVRRSQGDQGRT